ncbi:hypothetical protein N836_19315 [Leptolyngbya sp. Heron Island J]|uniref:hypothetical protein n=1 Tax=Leptolyngbya sp. Heron Island J TaxID=1385935 RepID=UPI0003B9DE46|nr:hypothetical protein [Leptolyngbya sp. Heron Island J]ESA33950.1 hypothetical protein N836_19315 [Leptolyngbya sp. Heron Island J]
MQMTYLRLWVLTNVLGFMLSLLSISVISFVGPLGNGLSAAGWGLGLALGGMQASVLRRRLIQLKVWHWMVATGLGTYVGSALSAFSNLLFIMTGQGVLSIALKFFPSFAESMASTLMSGLLLVGHEISIGISVGIAQVLVVRRYTPNWRLWWTMGLLGFTLGGTIVFYGALSVVGLILDISWASMIRGLCFGAVGGVIYGSITAIALKKLRPRQHRI